MIVRAELRQICDDFIDELKLKDFKRNRKDWLFTLENLLDPKIKTMIETEFKKEMKELGYL